MLASTVKFSTYGRKLESLGASPAISVRVKLGHHDRNFRTQQRA
jgi:hypothetical protein